MMIIVKKARRLMPQVCGDWYRNWSERNVVHLRGHQPHKLEQTRPRTEAYKQSFFYSTIQLWNDLISDIALASLSAFKTHVFSSI